MVQETSHHRVEIALAEYAVCIFLTSLFSGPPSRQPLRNVMGEDDNIGLILFAEIGGRIAASKRKADTCRIRRSTGWRANHC
jgi:hypothetical protein